MPPGKTCAEGKAEEVRRRWRRRMRLSGATRTMDADGEAGAGFFAVVYSRTSNLAGFLVAMLTTPTRELDLGCR